MKRILITGARGMLGTELLRKLGNSCSGSDLPDLDVTVMDSVRSRVSDYKPHVIINAAAITDVDYCETNPEEAEKVHCRGVANLCASGTRVITLSTDHVFTDGLGKPLCSQN